MQALSSDIRLLFTSPGHLRSRCGRTVGNITRAFPDRHRLQGMRCANIYDVDNKTYLLKVPILLLRAGESLLLAPNGS